MTDARWNRKAGRLMNALKRIAILLGCLVLAGFSYEQWAERRDAERFPLPGKLMSVGDHRLHIWCTGQGQPAVLLISGDGTPSVTMYSAQHQIAKFTRVCSYDRAGLGWSDPARKAMSLSDQVNDFEQVVNKAKLTRPKIVPASLGSRPLVLIQHGKAGGMGIPEQYEAQWPSAQRKLASLSAESTIVVAKENHHPIAEENPALVTEQVRLTVERLRRNAVVH